MDLATIAQFVAAGSNLVLAVVVVVSYYLFIKIYKDTLYEMRASRSAEGRPQVLFEADYTRIPLIDIVVRNVGGGTAKDLRFDFSALIESPTGFVLSERGYFQAGITFLGSGEEVRSFWGTFNDLLELLREKGLDEGITVTVKYQDLGGESYEDRWTINPLHYEGEPLVGRYKGINDLVEVVEKISTDVEKISTDLQELVRSWEEARENGNGSQEDSGGGH
jgi:hypothetical protein